MNRFKANQTVLQLIVGFTLTLFAVIYALVVLTDAINAHDSAKVLYVSLSLLILAGIDFYLAHQIIRIVRTWKKELEDS